MGSCKKLLVKHFKGQRLLNIRKAGKAKVAKLKNSYKKLPHKSTAQTHCTWKNNTAGKSADPKIAQEISVFPAQIGVLRQKWSMI